MITICNQSQILVHTSITRSAKTATKVGVKFHIAGHRLGDYHTKRFKMNGSGVKLVLTVLRKVTRFHQSSTKRREAVVAINTY